MKVLEGKLNAEGAKIGMVAARFNDFIVSRLVDGAEDALVRHGVNPDDITLANLVVFLPSSSVATKNSSGLSSRYSL